MSLPVTVRFFDLDALGIDEGMLTEAERARVARKATERLRQRQAASFAMTRTVLGEALGLPPGRVPIEVPTSGKPCLGQGAGLHFNVSHSDGVGMVALAPREVGADIEALIPRPRDALAEEILSAGELEAWAGVAAGQRQAWLTRAWTRKEAALKAIGSGLRIPPRRVDVGGGENEGRRWRLELEGRLWRGMDWGRDVPAGFLAAVCIEATDVG